MENEQKYEEVCKTCHYWLEEDIGQGHVCVNSDSPFAADWTEEDDSCSKYTPKRRMKL